MVVRSDDDAEWIASEYVKDKRRMEQDMDAIHGESTPPEPGSLGAHGALVQPSCETAGVRSSLYELAEGEPALLPLAAAHHARCLADPELNHPFSHGLVEEGSRA